MYMPTWGTYKKETRQTGKPGTQIHTWLSLREDISKKPSLKKPWGKLIVTLFLKSILLHNFKSDQFLMACNKDKV